MHGVFPFALLADGWFTSRTMGLAMWGGLAVLTVSLLILMRTRWGQAQPLSKCVVLSVFAHVLFMGYAYGTKLIFDVPPREEEQVLKLGVIDANLDFEAPDAPVDALQPWDRLASEAASPADIESPARAATMFDEPTTAVAMTQPPVQTNPTAVDLPLPEPERPLPAAAPLTPPPLLPAEIAAAQTAPPPRETVAEDSPADESPASMTPEVAPPLTTPDLPRAVVQAEVPEPAETESPPGELMEADGEQIQRLADVAIEAKAADAAPAEVDQLAATADGVATPGDPARDKRLPEQAAEPFVAAEVVPSETQAAPEAEATAVAVRRPGDGKPLPAAYQLRKSEHRLRVAERYGGNLHTEGSVDRALAWLASAQAADGRWDANRYGAGTEAKSMGHDRHAAGTDADTGITGLALLAFLAAGHTHLEGVYREHVQHGLEFLLRSQGDNGNLYGDARLFARMYCHGIAALALGEAYVMTGDHRLLPFLQRSTRYTRESQHATLGGWRYQPGDKGDMSQFGWQVMALRSAELAGIEIPSRTRTGMLRFLREARSGAQGGLAAYRVGERPSRTMTAEALACHYFLRVPTTSARVNEARDFIHRELPGDGQVNLYYWYYGSLALLHSGDPRWQRWNAALQDQLLRRQQQGGELNGSWDPDTVWGGYGGRIYTTAMATLCLEVYYRYLPLFDEAGRR